MHVVYTHAGARRILSPAPGHLADLVRTGLSEAEALRAVLAADLPEGAAGVQVLDGPPAPTLDERRAAAVAAVGAERDRRLAEGAPYLGRRIDVSDRARADLAGMALAAVLAAQGGEWGDGHSRGWIARDNTRLPLPTPTDGIALATAVGDWHAATVQHARDLKDRALSSGEPETVEIASGWP